MGCGIRSKLSGTKAVVGPSQSDASSVGVVVPIDDNLDRSRHRIPVHRLILDRSQIYH